MSYTATAILILISWLILWRWCAHFYYWRGFAASHSLDVAHQGALYGPQTTPKPVSAPASTWSPAGEIARKEAVQGLVGLGWPVSQCREPVMRAEYELTVAGRPITTEALLRAVMSKRATQIQ